MDIKNNTIVKGIHLEGLRVVGVPEEASRKYYAQGADEILYMDAVASLYERNSLLDIVRRVADNVFVPLTVGGGLRTVQDIRDVLRAGADKVTLNTAAIRRPELIREAVGTFGSQCIVVSIEAKKKSAAQWEAYIDTGREATGIDVLKWAERVAKLGAGELLITSIDHEGMKKGFEIDLIRCITNAVPIPVIACGGCGGAEHIEELFKVVPVSAVACASIFHYDLCSIPQVKKHLLSRGILVSDRNGLHENCYR